jgi:diguanylate cyclase (GGDEF)-like protein
MGLDADGWAVPLRPAATASAPVDAWCCLLEGLPHAAWVVALASRRVVAANAAAVAFLGRPLDVLLGADALALAATPEDQAWWAGAADAAAGVTVENLHSETLLADADGRVRHALRSIGLIHSGQDQGQGRDQVIGASPSTHALVMICDRSAEHAMQDESDRLLAELQATLEATADGILVTGVDGRLRAFNRRFAEIWNLPADLLHAEDDGAIQAWMAAQVLPCGGEPSDTSRLAALQRSALGSAGDRLELRSGQVLERVTRPLLSGGRAQGRVWSFRDLTARVVAEARIEALALHDALTGLANRAGLAARVEQAASLSRREGQGYALLYIDLDHFRHINDSLGHETGDRVLIAVAQRIQACLRADDVLARLGGDQFAVLVAGAEQAAAETTARRVLNVVAQPCNVDGAAFTLTCSIDLALAPSHGQRIGELARHAEAAMRGAKQAGRAGYRLHQARAEGDRRLHLRLDHAMRQALVSGRFRLHYQPQVDLASGAIVGAEALLRWRDPEMGEIPPGRFIPVAEETGFIIALGEWVLNQAVRQAALWHSKGQSLPIAVNVSALQFQQAHFVDRVAAVLAISGLPPRLLELELTESILVHDAEDALSRLHALERLGVQTAIDDFGTGYSSLSYLKRFPIGKLKIDRSFVTDLPGDDSDAAIVRAILQMARALGKKVIAEGVETEAQRQFLQDAGCDEFQGFLVAPALDTLSFEALLRRGQAAPPPAAPRIRLVGT